MDRDMNRDFWIERTIRKIGNHLMNGRDDDLKRYNLTSNQSNSLLYFDKHPGALVLDLKDYLKISHQAARNIVERMKEKDLLYVVVSEKDARARQIYLTESGQATCDELKKLGSQVGTHLLRGLSEEEKQTLAGLLEKIVQDL